MESSQEYLDHYQARSFLLALSGNSSNRSLLKFLAESASASLETPNDYKCQDYLDLCQARRFMLALGTHPTNSKSPFSALTDDVIFSISKFLLPHSRLVELNRGMDQLRSRVAELEKQDLPVSDQLKEELDDLEQARDQSLADLGLLRDENYEWD